MCLRTALLAILTATSTMGVVAANEVGEEEPVLRLRLQDPTTARLDDLALRPRFESNISDTASDEPTQRIRVSEVGRVGTFAYVPTPVPNVVVTLGATDDASELGRQIDRAIIEMTRGDMLFTRQSDSAPFIGMGVRSGSARSGWSAEANMGVGMVNTPEASRLSGAFSETATAAYEADARAHFRVRYAF